MRRWYPPLLRFLTAKTGDPEEAADLAQETFLIAWQRLDRLRPDQPFVPWFYRVARYTFLPWWRRRWVLRHTSLDMLVERGEAAVRVLTRPSNDLVGIEERESIQHALDGLSPLQQEALLLHELKGLSARQVAEVLGISPAAAERRIGRALAEFRRQYDDLMERSGG